MMTRAGRIGQAAVFMGFGAAAALIGASTDPARALAANSWTATMAVEAVGESAMMPAGQSPTATIVQGAISITWGPSTFHSGKEVAGYVVNRQPVGSSTAVAVCKVVAPNRVCRDSPPLQQNVMYTVVPTDSSWVGRASAPSAPVMLPDPPPTATPSAAPSVNATASPSPSPSATPSPTPSTTPMASPSASATSSATPSPTSGPTLAPSPT